MKNLFLALSVAMVASQAYAGIQGGKVVADVVAVSNMSFFPIKVNGQKISVGTTVYLRVGECYGTNSIKDKTITIKLNNKERHSFVVPVKDENDGIVTPYGGHLKEKPSRVPSVNTNGELQYNIEVTSNWLIGQHFMLDEKFEIIQKHYNAAITALAANKVA